MNASDNVTDSGNATTSTPTIPNWLETANELARQSSQGLTDLGYELAQAVIETVRRQVHPHDRRDLLGVIASHLLTVGLKSYGDDLGDHDEPKDSIVGQVMSQFDVLGTGRMDLVDIRLPAEAYRQYNTCWDAVAAKYKQKGLDELGRFQDASMDFAMSSSYEGCRLGAHLAVALMNASDHMRTHDFRIYRAYRAD